MVLTVTWKVCCEFSVVGGCFLFLHMLKCNAPIAHLSDLGSVLQCLCELFFFSFGKKIWTLLWSLWH